MYCSASMHAIALKSGGFSDSPSVKWIAMNQRDRELFAPLLAIAAGCMLLLAGSWLITGKLNAQLSQGLPVTLYGQSWSCAPITIQHGAGYDRSN